MVLMKLFLDDHFFASTEVRFAVASTQKRI